MCAGPVDTLYIYQNLTSLKSDESAHGFGRAVPIEDGLQLPDGDLRVEVGRRGLHSVHVPHEDRVLEFDVRLVLVLELLRVEGADAGTKLQFQDNASCYICKSRICTRKKAGKMDIKKYFHVFP